MKNSALIVALAALGGLLRAAPLDPIAIFAPDVVISRGERARLDRGDTVVRVTPGRDGLLSLIALVRVETSGDRLLAWSADIETSQKGRYIPEIGRFSPTPRVEDLEGLVIEAEDLRDLARCRPGKCAVKLSAGEMASFAGLESEAAGAARFRRMLVHRAREYLTDGDRRSPPYEDHEVPVVLAEAYDALVRRLEFFPRRFGAHAHYLEGYPAGTNGHVHESFLYWSKETLGMKPIISITHFSSARYDTPGMPEAVVVAKQVYASHYKNSSITITALAGSRTGRYLVYINRSHVDAFSGVLGSVVRRLVEQRVRDEAPGILRQLRDRLEQRAGTNVAPLPPTPAPRTSDAAQGR